MKFGLHYLMSCADGQSASQRYQETLDQATRAEALGYIRRAWTEERFSFQGRFFQADDLALAPRPIQQPHPPIRIAVNSAETAAWAGREGYPIFLASNINPFPKLRELVPLYRGAGQTRAIHRLQRMT